MGFFRLSVDFFLGGLLWRRFRKMLLAVKRPLTNRRQARVKSLLFLFAKPVPDNLRNLV